MIPYKGQHAPTGRLEAGSLPRRTSSTRIPSRTLPLSAQKTNGHPTTAHSTSKKFSDGYSDAVHPSSSIKIDRQPLNGPKIPNPPQLLTAPGRQNAVERSMGDEYNVFANIKAMPPSIGFGDSPATPSLVSGSTASTEGSPNSRIQLTGDGSSALGLRYGAGLGKETAPTHDTMVGGSSPNLFRDPFPESILGYTLPQPSLSSDYLGESIPLEYGQQSKFSYERSNLNGMSNYHHKAMTPALSPPTFHQAFPGSPSTRYTESPGVFSHSSTPTSMSSHSPGFGRATRENITPSKSSSPAARPSPTTRMISQSPTIMRPHRLSSVRESCNSSSSNSTVQAGEKNQTTDKDYGNSTVVRSHALANGVSIHTPPSIPLRSRFKSSNTTSMPESARAQSTVPPPELAHLVHARPPIGLNLFPARPSRDGAPTLLNMREPSPIIQSNLTSITMSSHRRNSSAESKNSSFLHPMSPKRRFGQGQKTGTPSSSRKNISETSLPTLSRPGTRETTPDHSHDRERRKLRKESRPPATATPKSSSRFGFFSRRVKSEAKPVEKEKSRRKGPMAGTGHEGYGKYAFRGRSGSSSTSDGSSLGRSESADSVISSQHGYGSSRHSSISGVESGKINTYFQGRLSPVIIRGQGSSKSSLEMATSKATLQLQPNSEPNERLKYSHTPITSFKPPLLPSHMATRSNTAVAHQGGPASRQYDAQDATRYISSSAQQQQQQYHQHHQGQAGYDSGSGSFLTKSMPLTSIGSSFHGSGHLATATGVAYDDAHTFDAPQQARGAIATEDLESELQPDGDVTKVTAAVSRLQPIRTIPHYAMMEPIDKIDVEDLEKLMQEADVSHEESSSSENMRRFIDVKASRRLDHQHSILLPSPPSIMASFSSSPVGTPAIAPQALLVASAISDAAVEQHTASNNQGISPTETGTTFAAESTVLAKTTPIKPVFEPPARPSRLPQVGRIPRVISTRDRDRKLPDQSFSRPFLPEQPRPALQTPKLEMIGSSSNPSVPGIESMDSLENDTADSGAYYDIGTDATKNAEFFAMPPRKDSDISYSSSSGGFSILTPVAVVPMADAPLSEDEVWNEYDDLIDEVMSPNSSSTHIPGLITSRRSKLANRLVARRETKAETVQRKTKSRRSLSTNDTTDGIKDLRKSQTNSIGSLGRGSGGSTSITNILTEYSKFGGSGLSDNSAKAATSRESGGSARSGSSSVYSTAELAAPRVSGAGLEPNSGNPVKRNATFPSQKMIEDAENKRDGLVPMANLRFGALMTSKWLSFGRVLFSPAQQEMKCISEDRILVLDGLGKDWSYYCALTYSNAAVYNLGLSPADASLTSGQRESGAWQSLANHQQIYMESLDSQFPFPRGFFAAVVFRFPGAASEQSYRHAISECKRVLRPGGYLEMSVLDIDMVNMGNRARRAIRGLKVKMQNTDPNISLKPTADMIQRLLGRRGFENLNRCMVGVPVAGKVSSPSSSDTSTEELTTSFSELLKDSSGAGADQITSMVARVGRWWYSRCYESILMEENAQLNSIWHDEELLRECEEHQTGFRLLICYAQNPAVPPRRTASV